MNEIFKLLLIFLGTVSLVLGIAGIAIPGLPATPFLLLTAGLYIRSSRKLYELLISHRILGPYVTRYSNGMNKRLKRKAILIMWIMILISIFFLIDINYIKIILFIAGLTGTFIVTILPESKITDKKKDI